MCQQGADLQPASETHANGAQHHCRLQSKWCATPLQNAIQAANTTEHQSARQTAQPISYFTASSTVYLAACPTDCTPNRIPEARDVSTQSHTKVAAQGPPAFRSSSSVSPLLYRNLSPRQKSPPGVNGLLFRTFSRLNYVCA